MWLLANDLKQVNILQGTILEIIARKKKHREHKEIVEAMLSTDRFVGIHFTDDVLQLFLPLLQVR